MLVHGYTGAIDILNQQIVQYLYDNKNNLSKDSFPYSDNIWNQLCNRGYLTNKSFEEEILHVQKMADLLHRLNIKSKKSFGFLISYNCNFRCPYCYEAKISNFGNHWSLKTFDKKLVDEAYEAMCFIEPSKKLHSKSILLYGGEPLLKENRDIVEYIVEKGYALGYVFSAITNGYDLDSYIDLLSPDKIAALQITIDGCKESHDKTRKHKDGYSTFDKIISNIKIALEKQIHLTVRMNCTENNIEDISHLKDIFKSAGFYTYKGFYFYSALTYDYLQEYKSKDSFANSLKFMRRLNFVNQLQKNASYNFEDEGFERKLTDAILGDKRMLFSPTYCAAFSGSYLFDPNHNIYSCWESLGRPEAVVGHYEASMVQFNATLEGMHSYNIGKSEKCRKCKFVFLCRGGCPMRKNENLCSLIPEIFSISANKAYINTLKCKTNHV